MHTKKSRMVKISFCVYNVRFARKNKTTNVLKGEFRNVKMKFLVLPSKINLANFFLFFETYDQHF